MSSGYMLYSGGSSDPDLQITGGGAPGHPNPDLGFSKTFTSRFLGVQRGDNLQVILLLGQDGSFLTEPENHT